MATVLVNAGRAVVTGRIKGVAGVNEPIYIGWGTGAGTSNVTDTTLFSEAPEARVEGVSSQVTTAVTNDTYQVVGTLTASAARTITNVGTFTAASGGSLFIKADFPGISLNAGDSIQFTIKAQVE